MHLDRHYWRRDEKNQCCMSLGDNTSTVGWNHISNFCDETQLPHEEVARHLARLCVDSVMYIHAQHFKGMWNLVTEWLSRDHHIPAHVLTVFYVYLSLLRCPNFSNTCTVTRDWIVDSQNSAIIIEASARSEGTDGKCNRIWARLCGFLGSIELGNDFFLDHVSEEHRPAIFILFAQAVRDRKFSRSNKRDLAQGTVREALYQVAAIFAANKQDQPFKDWKKLDYELDFMMKGHKASDPLEQQELSLTPYFYGKCTIVPHLQKRKSCSTQQDPTNVG